MTTRPTRWTAHDLELYLDQELPPNRLAELEADLAADPALRRRLVETERLDILAARALLIPRPRSSPAIRVRPRVLLVGLCAASLLLAIGAPWLVLSHPPAPGPRPPIVAVRDPLAPRPDPDSAQAETEIRVLLTLRLRDRTGRLTPAVAPPAPPPVIASAFSTACAAAMAQGRTTAAADMLKDADEAERRRGYLELGRAIHAAAVAKDILAAMEPAQRLEVCRIWAAEPDIQPVVFACLRDLNQIPELRADVRTLALELSDEPTLRSWVVGYALLRPPVS